MKKHKEYAKMMLKILIPYLIKTIIQVTKEFYINWDGIKKRIEEYEKFHKDLENKKGE